MRLSTLLTAVSPVLFGLASCGSAPAGDNEGITPSAADTGLASSNASSAASSDGFTTTEIARFDEPWAMTFIPGTPLALVTERKGRLKLWQEGGAVRDVSGVPLVAYGGQGGLGDIVLAPDHATSGIVYLTWAEQGEGDTRGAALGRARLVSRAAPGWWV